MKPWQQLADLGDETVGRLSPMFVIPLDKIDVNAGIKIRSNAKEVARLAAASSAKIPDASKSMNLLVKAYLRFPLGRFHKWFYSEEHDADALWPETYDLTPINVLPPNVCDVFEHPNDLLLRPGCVRLVVRAMLSLGWHPRHIAGLIRSKYS